MLQIPTLLDLTPDDHSLRELTRIRAGELEQALLVLPLSQVRRRCCRPAVNNLCIFAQV